MSASQTSTPVQENLDPLVLGSELWESARKRLQDEGALNDTKLQQLNSPQNDTPEKVVRALESNREKVEANHGDRLDRLIERLSTLCGMVDTWMIFAPETVHIVWTAFRVLTEFFAAKEKFREVILDAMDTMTNAILFCDIFISQCRIWSKAPNVAKEVRQIIPQIYYDIHCLFFETLKWTMPDAKQGALRAIGRNFKITITAMFGKTREFELFIQSMTKQLERLRHLNAENNHIFVVEAFKELCTMTANNQQTLEQLVRSFASFTDQSAPRFEQLVNDRTAQLMNKIEAVESSRRNEEEDQKMEQAFLKKLEWLQDGTKLKASEPDEERLEKTKKMSKGTCGWILHEEEFQSWHVGTEKKLLWVVGRAGSGKSFLCSSITNHLLMSNAEEDIGTPIVISFFCRIGDESRCTGEKIMLHILVQLFSTLSRPRGTLATSNDPQAGMERSQILAKSVQILREETEKKHQDRVASSLDITTCASVFSAIATELPCKIFIVIDALDECIDRRDNQLLDVLVGMAEQMHNIHLLVSSRDEHDIKNILLPDKGREFASRIEVGEDSTKEDIGRYLEGVLSHDYKFRPKDVKSWAEIIVARSEGIFQYAAMAIRHLHALEAMANPDAAIKRLPKGLSKLYDQRLLEMVQPAQKCFHIMLRWLACGEGPVKLMPIIDEFGRCYLDKSQIDEAEASENGTVAADEDEAKTKAFMDFLNPHVRDFIKYNQETTVIEVQHASIMDWINDTVGKASDSPTWDIHPQRGHFIMAQNFMRTLTHPSFQRRYLSSSSEPTTELRYEVTHWDYHVRKAEAISSTKDRSSAEWKSLYDEIDTFMGLGNSNKAFFDIWAKQVKVSDTPIRVAAQLGLLCTLERFFDRAQEDGQYDVLGFKDGNGNSPLHLVCQGKGNLIGLEFILERDASQVNVKAGDDGETPLLMMFRLCSRPKFQPSPERFLVCVHQLLQRGAQADVKGRRLRTCLHYAMRLGSLEICDEIIKQKNVDINAQTERGSTPLHVLIRIHKPSVKMPLRLLQTQSFEAAEAKLSVQIAQRLLDAGADVQRTDENGRTLLIEAASAGNTEIAQMILERAVDNVNVRSGMSGETALHKAAEGGNSRLVRLLLENGADITLQDERKNMTAFDIALRPWSYLNMYPLSLSGLDPGCRGFFAGFEDILQILLERTPKDQWNVEILSQAIEMKSTKLCRLFASFVHIADAHGWTPLLHAEQEDEEIHQLLMGLDRASTQRKPLATSALNLKKPTSWTNWSNGDSLCVTGGGLTVSGSGGKFIRKASNVKAFNSKRSSCPCQTEVLL
ncbi:uncharacterized protein IWZ02DRAFT_462024 [Phyllosticta citriasiana]|uniref:uncharacterized protein n=1 Tax=Phyllosticta citriasiana TaxID=595635 RepID=UPI0030FD421C